MEIEAMSDVYYDSGNIAIGRKILERYHCDIDDYFRDRSKAHRVIESEFSEIFDSESEGFAYVVAGILNEPDPDKRIDFLPLISKLCYCWEDFLLLLLRVDYFDTERLGELLGGYSISVSGESLSEYHWEKLRVDKYWDDNSCFNILGLYEFKECLERGRGLPYDDVIGFIVKYLLRSNGARMFQKIGKTTNFLTVISISQYFDFSNLSRVSRISDNIYFKYEAVRVILNKHPRGVDVDYSNQEVEGFYFFVDQIQKEMHHHDMAKFFLSRMIFGEGLLYFIPGLFSACSPLFMNAFVEELDFSVYGTTSGAESWGRVLENMKDSEIRRCFSKFIYDRWILELDEFDGYLGSLYLTDFVNVVLFWLKEHEDCNSICERLCACVKDIEQVDNFWFEDIVNQNLFLYKRFSLLFVFGIVAKSNECFDLVKNVEVLVGGSLLLGSEMSTSGKMTSKQLFEKYLFF